MTRGDEAAKTMGRMTAIITHKRLAARVSAAAPTQRRARRACRLCAMTEAARAQARRRRVAQKTMGTADNAVETYHHG